MNGTINLQYFADAGTVVNATNGYVNSSTGERTSFTDNKTLSPELKDYYDSELLENTRNDLVYAQFAKRQKLPKNHHGVVEWRKWNAFAPASKLTEGVIPTGQTFGTTTVRGSVDQYGTYTSITDKLELRAYDDIILGAAEEMGASAETQEKLIRDALLTGTNVLYCDNIVIAPGAASSADPHPETQAKMVSTATDMCMLTPAMVNKAVTILKKNRVPRIRGRYYAVVHPSVAHDLRETDGWIEAHKYASPEELFNGEIGELHGVRFIEDAFAPVLWGADLASNSRSLKINHEGGYTGAVTSVAFDGGTVAADALIGRTVIINGIAVKITDNTSSALTFASTDLGTVADNADIYPGEGGAAGAAVYATYFFGKDSFGIIDPEGGALEMIIHDKGEIGGPLNQFSTIGYKFETNGATILYSERLLRVMSCSSFSGTDEAN